MLNYHNDTFPLEQVLISNFTKPIKLDRNSRDGGSMLFIRDNFSFKLLKPGNFSVRTESLFVEINLRKKNG